MAASIAIAGFAAPSIGDANKIDPSSVSRRVDLQFFDEPDGGVMVRQALSNEPLYRFPPETGGFVRVAMRAVVHSRKKEGVGPETPFTLMETFDGRLILHDRATSKQIELAAFGADNAATFRVLLNAGNGS